MVDSSDFAQALAEADDIARSVNQRLTSAHALLALFTFPNRAQILLRERGVDEDRLLQTMTLSPKEQDPVFRELCERTREIAQSCGCREADCLHFLIAITRLRCSANELLARTGLDLIGVRNTALSYYLSGRMPRRFQIDRTPTKPAIPEPPKRGVTLRSQPSVAVGLVGLADDAAPIESAPPAPQPLPRELFDAEAELAPEPSPSVSVPEEGSVTQGAPLVPSVTAPHSGMPQLDPKLYPLLTSLGRNLTALAREGRLDPVIGRGREIEEVIDVLGKRRTNNPCLVGEPGVGKTAVVEGVAQRLLDLHGSLSQKILIELDMATLVAGTQLRGSFSEKLNGLKDEVRRAEGRVVVFIDELHTLIGAGSTGDGPQDAANELKSAMARGEFPCIGATTHDEYRKYIAPDPALERRFTAVSVNEPSVPETVEILRGVLPRYEEHHGLKYTAEAVEAAAALSAKYISDRFLPDKAISLIDLAGSRCHREARRIVEAADVARVVAQVAKLPVERLLMTDSARLLRLEADLSERVIGHDDNIHRVAKVIRRNYAGFSSRRPMGSFLFLGPTGVGKTELGRALAEVLFGNKDALVRLDMSEMAESHSVSRLIGAPAGYVGHGDGGQLTEPVRRKPSCVLVLDEIEKAHRDVQLLLLQVLEEGRLTDGKGRHIDFSNTVIVLTTNLGSEVFAPARRAVGFTGQSASPTDGIEAAQSVARTQLPAELWNRIDERLTFRPLQEVDVAKIALLLLEESSRRLSTEKGIAYSAGEDVVDLLLEKGGFDPQLGARPMRQMVQRWVEGPLAERILAGEFGAGDHITVQVSSGRLDFKRGLTSSARRS